MKEIKLSQWGKNKGLHVALIDDEDFERVNEFNWFVIRDRCGIFYAGRKIRIDKKQATLKMHTFLMGRNWIDHEDGNGLNCQRYNMRPCTQQQNNMNKSPRRGTSSKYKGVYFYKPTRKYSAHIRISGKKIHLGYFETDTEAANMYNKKAIELFGEFARLNINT